MTAWLVGAADGVADHPAGLLAEARCLEAGARRFGVRVRVQRQDGVADVVLDERQGAAGRRVVGVRDAADTPYGPATASSSPMTDARVKLDKVVLVQRDAHVAHRTRHARDERLCTSTGSVGVAIFPELVRLQASGASKEGRIHS